MRAPTPTDAAAPAPVRVEVVTRPEPGLARGVWEAPRWAFYAALATVILLSALYAARRTHALSRLQRWRRGHTHRQSP